MTMDPDETRGVMNQLLYPIDGAPDLSDATAARMVDNLIDGRLFASPVASFAEAIDSTVRAGSLHPEAAEMSRRFSSAELLDFVRRVGSLLEERRPWPPPKFTKLDVSAWSSFGQAPVIAQVNRPTLQLTGAVGFSFDQVPAGEGKLPVLVLRLRTGEEVALMGSVDPRSSTFALLYGGTSAPADVIASFLELSRLRPADITTM
ncbi:hypothetical protein KOI35_42680 [Actinoplanes bogorensis]|uniref:DUF1707 domain-containing protein n=1 Tax=Paractinoplanes bogorensis TaxID=1610840 RepID=A0ABS5Z3I6_9ACTN|nr:hypothetical protein [Actinoplanes bogorensis]MBU2670228.1 hypothetical protein [Actinoplanes bogorensis]